MTDRFAPAINNLDVHHKFGWTIESLGRAFNFARGGIDEFMILLGHYDQQLEAPYNEKRYNPRPFKSLKASLLAFQEQ